MVDERSFLLVPNHSMAIAADAVGIEAAEAELLRVVQRHFTRVGIAAFADAASNSSLAGAVPRAGVAVHPLNWLEHAGSRVGKTINYVAAALMLPFALRRYDFLYIFFPGYCGLLAALWARLFGKPYGLYVRGAWRRGQAPTAFWWRWVFNGASFMIATGESFRRQLLVHCPQVVNEVPLTALRPAQITPPDAAARAPMQLLFAGQLTERKGVHDAIRAVALLRAEGRDIRLAIAGGGVAAQIESLQQLRRELQVEDAVTLLGHITPAQMAEAYRGSGVFVFPSYYAEGFPRVLYEAMMYALPIITCEMPGTEGFLIDGDNCLYCRPADPTDLAAALRRLFDRPALAAAIGRKARADVENLYASFIDESHAQQLLRFLRSDTRCGRRVLPDESYPQRSREA